MQAGSGASQAWPSVQGTPLLGHLGKRQVSWGAGLTGSGCPGESVPKGRAEAEWKGPESRSADAKIPRGEEMGFSLDPAQARF